MIRPATAADAAAAAEVERRARCHADELLDPDLLEVAERELALVAEAGGRVVAFVAAGEELVLAVDPAAQGAGLGAELLARADGRVAWVPERDGLARAVLASRGWRETGERRDVGWPEVRLTREPCSEGDRTGHPGCAERGPA